MTVSRSLVLTAVLAVTAPLLAACGARRVADAGPAW